MAADATIVSLRSDTAKTPAAEGADAAARRNRARAATSARPSSRRTRAAGAAGRAGRRSRRRAAKSGRRRWLRWILFALLPLALIAGGYWYVTGGRVMSTDNAYVEADKVGISTDVSGIVKEVDVDRQPAGRRRARSCSASTISRSGSRWIAPRRRSGSCATISTRSRRTTGTCRRRSSRRRTISTITIANSIASRISRPSNIASQATFDTARRNLQNAQQKLASLQPAARRDRRQPQRRSRHRRSSSIRVTCEAMAQRDEAARQLDHTVVKAPFAGIVTNVPALAARQVSRRPRRPPSIWSRRTTSGSTPTRRRPS